MSRSNRLYNLALKGCLIGLIFVGTVGPALTQESAPEQLPTVEKSQGIAIEAPPPENEAAEAAAEQKAPTDEMLPPTPPVENKRPAEPACDADCQEAEQREKDDLEAQQSMASAAEDLVVITWWQFGAGGTGITLLIYTLYLTRNATKAAIEANRIARESAERQLRAYVHPVVAKVEIAQAGATIVRLGFKNSGQTPAHNIRIRTRRQCAAPTNTDFEIGHAESKRLSDLAPGEGLTSRYPVETEHFMDFRADLEAGRLVFFVHGDLKYDDAFGKKRATKFRFKLFSTDGLRGGDLDICDEGNEAT